MAHPSKRKGNTFEREIVAYLQDWGMDAERAYASNGRSLGLHEEVDILATHLRLPDMHISAKRRKSLPAYLKPTEVTPFVFLREDRGEMLVVLPANILMNLISKC